MHRSDANHRAYRDIVKNHGIPEDHIKLAVEAGKRFFALPDEVKAKVSAQHIFVFQNLV